MMHHQLTLVVVLLDVNIIVTSIGQDGAITGVRTRNVLNAPHMKEAKVINDVPTLLLNR